MSEQVLGISKWAELCQGSSLAWGAAGAQRMERHVLPAASACAGLVFISSCNGHSPGLTEAPGRG